MKQVYLILILTIFSTFPQEGILYKINPQTFTDNKILLSDLADDVLYIPLDNSIPIGQTYKLKITSSYLYLSIKDIGILKFDRSGKLVCKIGSRGRGPNEYQYFMDYTVDQKTGNVYVVDRNVIKVYSQTGLFVRDINYSKYLDYLGGDVEIFKSFLFIPDYIQYGNSKFNWIIFDTLGNLVSKKNNSIPLIKINLVIRGQIYIYEDRLFYFNAFNDTIFSVSDDLQSRGAYLFSKGDFRFPNTNFTFNSPLQLYDFFKPSDMFETKHYIFLTYSYLEKFAISLIDKKSKKIFLAYQYEGNNALWVKTRPVIQNNLDGGMPFSTRSICNYYGENDLEFISTLVDPFDLKGYLSSDEFKKSVPRYPEKKKDLEKLANSIKETDNPILMMVRLKK
jgi:hypothetical protein